MKINLKNLKHFKFGIKNLTPEQQLNVQQASGFGGFIGLSIALVSMIIRLWFAFDWQLFGFTLLVACMAPLQWLQYTNAKEQLKQIKEGEEALEKLKLVMGDKN